MCCTQAARAHGSTPGTAAYDRQLIARVRCGDDTALRALYERHSAAIYTLALRKLSDRRLAEAVLQDVFVYCWKHAASYHPEAGSVPAWLLGIARVRASDLQRGTGRTAPRLKQATGDGIAHQWAAAARTAPDGQVNPGRAVQEAFSALSAAQREMIALAYYEDLTQSQIAARFGEPLAAVKMGLRQAMECVRQSLAEPLCSRAR